MTIVHLQEIKGPKQSYCGLRELEITRRREKLVYTDRPENQKLKLGYRWCEECSNHPGLQLRILADTDLGEDW